MSGARLRLADGITFRVRTTVGELAGKVEECIADGQMFAVENDEGVVRYVNAAQVLYVEPWEEQG